tara:strand:+ start:296 stop:844 length:549 start_codon:yes stop_codon:yes gene_type:complete
MIDKPIFKTLYNWFSFYVYWYLCLWGAKQGVENNVCFYIGPLIGLIFILIHILIQKNKIMEIKYILICVFSGFCIESFYSYSGIIKYNGLWSSNISVPPIWILILWAGFGTTIFHSFKWIIGRNIFALFSGAIFYPIMYYFASEYGALGLNVSNINFLIISLLSSVNFYVLILIAKYLYEAE